MDLKNYRAPKRGPWPWIVGATLLIAATCIIGPMDFAERLRLEADNKVLRAKLARYQRHEAEVAPIRPHRKCRDKPFIARQADGHHWVISCAKSADLTGVKL